MFVLEDIRRRQNEGDEVLCPVNWNLIIK